MDKKLDDLGQGLDVEQDEGAQEDLERKAVARAFGAENRTELLSRYFAANDVTVANAWTHVYRLLLWIDRTTGLAHCYESDKSQPGRSWYARSLAFHDWVSQSLGVEPQALGDNIDWLFREAIKDFAGVALAVRNSAYERQRQPYAGRGFPEPGDDPELVAVVRSALRGYVAKEIPHPILQSLARRIYAYVTQENKRKNLVGEGFEDVLSAVMSRLPSASFQIRTRALLHQLPGFRKPVGNEKAERVDLSLVAENGRRKLITAKWSVRADRERQFDAEFQAYAHLETAGEDFDYVLITNEFDAARLKAACERRRQNSRLFTHVVHIAPAGVLAAYAGAPPRGKQGRTLDSVKEYVENGRLLGLSAWLASLG